MKKVLTIAGLAIAAIFAICMGVIACVSKEVEYEGEYDPELEGGWN